MDNEYLEEFRDIVPVSTVEPCLVVEGVDWLGVRVLWKPSQIMSCGVG